MKKEVFEFEQDFNTRHIIPEHIGRLFFKDGSCIRLYFGPEGLMAFIRKSKNSKCIYIEADIEDGISFAGLNLNDIKQDNK